MNKKILTLVLLIILLLVGMHFIPSNGQIIILNGNTRIDISLKMFTIISIITILVFHWIINISNWIRKIPSKWSSHRQKKHQSKQQEYHKEAIVCQLIGSIDESLSLFEKSSTLNAYSQYSLIDLLCAAHVAIQQKMPEKAQEIINKIPSSTILKPKEQVAKVIIQARIYEQLQQLQLAISILEQFSTQNHDHEAVNSELCQYLLSSENYEKLKNYLSKSITLSRDQKNKWIEKYSPLYMQQLIASNNTTKAIAHYNELAYNIQRKPATIITYCQALFIDNQEEKAISCLIEEFSNSPSLDILKTIYLICTKETTEAIIKYLEKNIQRNPGNYIYLVGKAMILIKNQKLKEASTLLTQANSQNPSPEIKMLISYCQKETKEEKDKK